MPFYEKRGMTAHQYPELVWNWLVLNRKPHSHWEVQSSPLSTRSATGSA